MTTATTTQSRKRSTSGRGRRGATLVVVAIMFTVVVGIAAMALDFSRMYAFKAQIKTLADAAAMSAILDRKEGRTEVQAETNAFVLIPINRVEGSGQATMAAADIQPVTWHPITRVANDTPWTLANAVKVATHYTSSYTLARIFGASSKTLHDTTVTLFGSLSTSNCIKPIAMPYAAILAKLGHTAPYNLNYNLTAADVEYLDNTQTEIQFSGLANNAAPDASAPGNFGWVDTNTGNIGNKNDEIASALTSCQSGSLGVGSTLEGVTGVRNANVVRDAIDLLCGGTTNCDLSKPPILIAIYDAGSGTGNNATFHVKYIGAFKFTRQNNQNDLFGYLTSTDVAPTGDVLPQPGPANIRPQIVK